MDLVLPGTCTYETDVTHTNRIITTPTGYRLLVLFILIPVTLWAMGTLAPLVLGFGSS